MPASDDSIASGVVHAIELLRQGDLNGARQALDLSPDVVSDADLDRGLRSFDKGMTLSQNGKYDEAIEPLMAALPIIEKTGDEWAKTRLAVTLNLAYGVVKLHSGDAHGAIQHLDIVTSFMEKAAFFDAGHLKFALDAKVLALVALARTRLAAGDIPEAEKLAARTEDLLRELKGLLDEEDPNDAGGFAEVYGLPVDFATGWAFHNLIVMDTAGALEQLERVADAASRLRNWLPRLPADSLRDLSEVVLLTNGALMAAVPIADRMLYSRRRVSKSDLERIGNAIKDLVRSRELAKRSGARGTMYIPMIDNLIRWFRNLIAMQQVDKRDFGRYAGLIAFAAFVVTMALVYFTIRPSEGFGLWYFLGALIVSLIVGFGFSALRFLPLLQFFRDAVGEKGEKAKE